MSGILMYQPLTVTMGCPAQHTIVSQQGRKTTKLISDETWWSSNSAHPYYLGKQTLRVTEIVHEFKGECCGKRIERIQR
jgi:hypothetical protein